MDPTMPTVHSAWLDLQVQSTVPPPQRPVLWRMIQQCAGGQSWLPCHAWRSAQQSGRRRQVCSMPPHAMIFFLFWKNTLANVLCWHRTQIRCVSENPSFVVR